MLWIRDDWLVMTVGAVLVMDEYFMGCSWTDVGGLYGEGYCWLALESLVLCRDWYVGGRVAGGDRVAVVEVGRSGMMSVLLCREIAPNHRWLLCVGFSDASTSASR